MSLLRSKDKSELIVTCRCGCDEGIHIRIERDHFENMNPTDDDFCYATCIGGNWYHDQDKSFWQIMKEKAKKIWAILRNKDFYYSEVVMTYKEAQEFRNYINEMIPAEDVDE